MISARLSGVNSGKVRMCLAREAQDPQRECKEVRGGTLSRAVFDAGRTQWNVTLIGLSDTISQYGTLTLTFNSLGPELDLRSFRFNGTNDPHNNGFEVVFGTAGDGTFHLTADLEGAAGAYPWQVDVSIDDASAFNQGGGPSQSVDISTAVSNGTVYTVTFWEPEAAASGPVFINDATLTWP
jgi:hypothetical protein